MEWLSVSFLKNNSKTLNLAWICTINPYLVNVPILYSLGLWNGNITRIDLRLTRNYIGPLLIVFETILENLGWRLSYLQLLVCSGTFKNFLHKGVAQMCPIKKWSAKFCKIHRKTSLLESLFLKSCRPTVCNFY